VGVVDSGYRGEIKFRFLRTKDIIEAYSVGDRIGQMMILPHPTVEFEEVEELSETQRGEGGYGSSGS
jgi:dUTP pyrophosphatase